MGFIKSLLAKQVFNYSMADFDRDVKAWMGGPPTHAGVNVNENMAMRHITVASCVRVRSESLAALPLSVYRKRRTGKGRDEAWDHPLYPLLHSVPNPDMVSFTWRETCNMHLDLSGNCYAIITTNGRGQVIEIYPVDWWRVEPQRNKESGRIEYRIADENGRWEVWPAEQVFHVPGFAFNGLKGTSIIRLAAEAVGTGMALAEFTARFFGQGMNMGGVLETPNAMKEEAVEALRKQFIERGAGLANSWLPIVLHSGLKYSRIPMPLEDAQALDLMRLNIEQICGLYRVPPHMVAELSRSTNNNIEHQGIEYVQYCMLPIITRWEQVMNWKLFTPAERAEGYYVKFNVDSLLRGDAAARAQYLNTKRQNGVINADEWRELDDENPIGGLAGEAYLVNGNMIATETAARQQPKQTASQQTLNKNIAKLGHLKNKMTPEEWEEEYEEGNAHWADDLHPSVFAQQFVEKLREEEITGSLLEIGCGNGHDSIFFARAGFDVTAVDVAPSALELAKENAEKAEVKINFVEANAEELPFADGEFKALFSLSVLHATDLAKSISETARVLVTDGLFSVYIYGTTENVNGNVEIHTTVDAFIELLKANSYEILDFYSEKEEDYDEAGERHQIIVALCRKLEGES